VDLRHASHLVEGVPIYPRGWKNDPAFERNRLKNWSAALENPAMQAS